MREGYRPPSPAGRLFAARRRGRKPRRRLARAGACLAALGLAALASRAALPGERGAPLPPEIAAAAGRAEDAMRDAMAMIRAEKLAAGRLPEPSGRGLLGEEYTKLTTTLGSLSAKRTSENPRWAGVLVERLWGAGLRKGDVVAAGLSGSFPGLNLALALACRSLELRLVAVSSVTASTFGANQPGFTWPEMEVLLARRGALRPVSVGVAAGGSGDAAADLEPEARVLAAEIAERSAATLGARYLAPRSLEEAIEGRLALYREAAKGGRISLYANVGGTEASLGGGEAFLELASGFVPALPFDLTKERGVMARMIESGVPALTLLNVRDLALRWGVPIDE
ncbi:MAG: poly-gamma-glutamate system protein [Spirochaetaceae bacterium]|nr:poly-gamma-glutamate system protein [Spirochaetaceae bacterium]